MPVFDAPADKAPRLPRDDFSVPFAEAIAWARERKAVLPAEFYGALLQAVRARSFSIAGLSALDQLQQVADSLAEATARGQTLRQWQRNLPDEVYSLGRARRELIFRNAVQTHYGIGRTIQQREHANVRGFLMWDAINDSRTRPAHAAMDGFIAPVGDGIWKRWSPPAGHNCRCTRIALTESQARARGYPKADPNVAPDKGWEGDPTEGNEDLVRVIKARQASCLTTFAAKRRSRGLHCEDGPARDRLLQMATALDHDGPMPAPRALTLPLLPAGTGEAEAFRIFMRAMGDETAREIESSPISGVKLSVSREMFTNHGSGASKLDKRGRGEFVHYLAETVLRPDEAWLLVGGGGDQTLTLISRYLRGRDQFWAVAVFKSMGGVWIGWSAYQSFKAAYIDSLRTGVIVYRRP
jgi:SPP1 gp7 family putative phage head morphogenesis protein